MSGNYVFTCPGYASLLSVSDGCLQDSEINSIIYVKVIQPVTGLSVDPSSLTLYINNDDLKFSVLQTIIQPADASIKDIEWTSSDMNVVSVDQTGEINALAPGSATITVKTSKRAGKQQYKATCKVKVAVQVREIKHHIKSWHIGVGKSYKFTPEIIPKNATNKKLLWSSSDKSIVTVDSTGTIKAIKTGSCTITCTSEDGGAKRDYLVSVINR